MTDTTIQPTQESNPHLVANIFMILFMVWASVEAFHDHRLLSAAGYISFSLAFLSDALRIRQRHPYGKIIYYGLFVIAVILGFSGVIRRLASA